MTCGKLILAVGPSGSGWYYMHYYNKFSGKNVFVKSKASLVKSESISKNIIVK